MSRNGRQPAGKHQNIDSKWLNQRYFVFLAAVLIPNMALIQRVQTWLHSLQVEWFIK
jgi:hypothetical protein